LTRILTTLLLLLGINSFGQKAIIDTLIIPLTSQFTNAQSNTFNFPFIKTGNHVIDSLINWGLKNRLSENEYPDDAIDSTLIKWAEDRINFFEFEVTFNNNGILSLHIEVEGCGAYCTSWTEYFNYCTKTGKILKLAEVVDTTGNFRTKIYAEKGKQYERQKNQLKELLSEADFDEDTYNWTLEEYTNCENSFNLNSFALYPDHLELIDKCYLPNVLKQYTPVINLMFKYDEIKDYLKLKI
jgi:hypothetical protein